MKDQLFNMFRHMTWSDDRIQQALEASVGKPEQALDLYAHLLAAEHVWLKRIEGKENDITIPLFPKLILSDCAKAAAENTAGYNALFERITEKDLQTEIEYRNSAGLLFRTKMADILTQVFMHGSYHRGQVNAALRGAGYKTTNVDYIAFTRL